MGQSYCQQNKSPNLISYELKLKNARQNFLLFAIMTVVNVALLLMRVSFGFSFSAFIPSLTAELSLAFHSAGQSDISLTFTVFSLALSALFVFLAVGLNKKDAFLPFALVLMLSDTSVFVVYFVCNIRYLLQSPISAILIMLLHGWVLYYLISAAVSKRRLKKTSMSVYDVDFSEIQEENREENGDYNTGNTDL